MSERTKRPPPRAKRAAPPPESPTFTTWRQLVRLSGLLRHLSVPHFIRFGISAAQWGVLRALKRLEDAGHSAPRLHELGAALLVQSPSLSATLDRMQRLGWIARVDDPEDRRTTRIALTSEGRDILARALPEHHAWIQRHMQALSPAEIAHLSTLLTKLTDHMLPESLDTAPIAQIPTAPRSPRPRRSRP